MVLTQALIDKLAAWQAAGNGVCIFREIDLEKIESLSDLKCGMSVYVNVYIQDYDVAKITEENWLDDFEMLVLKATVQECQKKIRRAQKRIAQKIMEVA